MTPLRQRMLDDMSIRNLAENTQLSYLQQVSAYAKFFDRSPDKLGPQEVRAYQIHLVQVRKLEASSVGIATSALRFLYRVTLKQTWAPDDIPMPKKPFKLPIVLSPGEVMHFLDPDGHPKLPHLWPVKLLQAGRLNYDDSGLMAMRAAASLRVGRDSCKKPQKRT